ncbi:MAG: cation diffusion facilitator family transporter [Patescibacteria group bacterium]
MKRSNIAMAIIINIGISVLEIIAGLLSSSLALISDAMHNFSDVGSLALSWWGEKIKEKKPNKYKTYGYKRAEIIIAFVNALVMVAVMIIILSESVKRLFHPVEVSGLTMLFVGVIAFIGNGLATFLLGKDAHKNLNLKSAWLHSFQDSIYCLGIIFGSILIYFFRWNFLDPIISILLSFVVLEEIYRLLKQSIDILMESVPKEIEFEKVKTALESFSGVKNAGDIHIWQTDSNSRYLSAHIEISDMDNRQRNQLLCDMQKILLESFNITHPTIQMVSVSEEEKRNFTCHHCN